VKLSLFLTDLLVDGNVVVPRTINDFANDDLEASLVLLRDFYDKDILYMPYNAPAFNEAAALWAAKYIFYVCQLILLRDVDEAKLQQYLQGFEGEQSSEACYNADLMLRFLPDFLRLASGLSPEDPLVANLKQTALQWPYSAVGIKNVNPTITPAILNDDSLRYAYIDKIIQYKDTGKLGGAVEKELLKEVLGEHQAILWPGLELLLPKKETI
jgi:hypothetical protein